MKIFNSIFIVLFIVSAALQYNDPDPYLWVPLYLYAALVCLLAFRGKYYPVMYYIGLAGYLAYAIYKVFDSNGVIDWVTQHDEESLVQTMKAAKPWIEEAREFFGLLICWAVLLINFIHYKITSRRLPKNKYSF
ncbi:transmembrane 220 family protein [Mucilaginibacter roseus]|uniref:Transmembrane 220 family protein n=1 Tax=Mucilaginibacter roseus TaxID=1528868 RepID=A0ABS8U4N4_9SPHI|nr:transmembrane 220 family protein [Mucilaginibacter roseus]MCD8741607.1 transmembrane 220 family protein [Mucilaginibacter roseus]